MDDNPEFQATRTRAVRLYAAMLSIWGETLASGQAVSILPSHPDMWAHLAKLGWDRLKAEDAAADPEPARGA